VIGILAHRRTSPLPVISGLLVVRQQRASYHAAGDVDHDDE
jgi:hypothetical protein